MLDRYRGYAARQRSRPVWLRAVEFGALSGASMAILIYVFTGWFWMSLFFLTWGLPTGLAFGWWLRRTQRR